MNALATVNNKAVAIQPAVERSIRRAEIAQDAIEHEAIQRKLLKEYVNKEMVDGVDFGVIPGTNKPARAGEKPEPPKKSLLKPGAEKLVQLFRCNAKFVIEEKVERWDDPGFFYYQFRCLIVTNDGDVPVAEGFGSANSREPRYRYRNADRKCPQCGTANIKKSSFPPKNNPEALPGWYCHAKNGGCGANFDAHDDEITSQVQGRVENPDIADSVNTILKIAKKRALVDAAITLARCSDIFTQDVEDMADGGPQPSAPRQANGDHFKVSVESGRTGINQCKTSDELKNLFTSLHPDIQRALVADKDRRKAELTGNGEQSPHPTSSSNGSAPPTPAPSAATGQGAAATSATGATKTSTSSPKSSGGPEGEQSKAALIAQIRAEYARLGITHLDAMVKHGRSLVGWYGKNEPNPPELESDRFHDVDLTRLLDHLGREKPKQVLDRPTLTVSLESTLSQLKMTYGEFAKKNMPHIQGPGRNYPQELNDDQLAEAVRLVKTLMQTLGTPRGK